MGIPKFFRYISERYPLTSQLIQENKIPEFDNLYIDFNGIIHNCSHPNDGDAHFRMTEEAIFTSIFTYVDHLFGKIKPKKLFFMAVDGVAPRAKMNQQRSRRFRTAKEAQEIKEKAESKGEKLPDEKAFDSNCITPGTPFMARLSEQLRYFVNKKISEDADWRGVEVVLSGHEVPGEGEHKIMEYIRLSKAQPGYNANVRHCLYGLDADLIMLGLLSHDPHFCLLREEVKFGPASKKKAGNTNLQSQNFFLLHLCLLREYLDLEFRTIAPTLSFEYNLERIIDDFVLIAVFVGNDFLPNLPDLHIHENGLERLFNIYKEVLPAAGGYINNSGSIDTARLQLVLNELAKTEVEVYQKENADSSWFKGKQRSFTQEMELAQRRGSLVMTPPQQDIFQAVRKAVLDHRAGNYSPTAPLTFPNDFSARERRFINTLATDLNLTLAWDGFDEHDRNVVSISFPSTAPVDASEAADGNDEEWEDEDEEDLAESNAAVDRVLKKYAKAKVINDDEDGDFETREARRLKDKMDEWKGAYYKEKLGFSLDDSKALSDLVYRYVEGLQWVMYYYYSGVASWGWFYNYHYSPRISDLTGLENMTFNFELGTPFKPYQQLMGVLPEASSEHIPLAYRDLMSDDNSPLLDFYPKTFDQDMNGKKQEWEAIVKIPFIDEKRLLKAMSARDHRLTPEEVKRNSLGTSTRFTYNPDGETVYESSLPGFFPALHHCTCKMEPFNLPVLDGLHLIPGLCDGVQLGSNALAGFPSINTLPYSSRLGHHQVNVFQSDSRNQSIVIEIDNVYEGKKTADIALQVVGKKTYIGWPFLQEGLVVGVSDQYFRHEQTAFGQAGGRRILANPLSPNDMANWRRSAQRIDSTYSKRYAVLTGQIDVLLHVRPLKGLKRLDTGALVKDYEGREREVDQAVQLGLQDVVSEDPRFLEKDAPPLKLEFPEGSRIFFLGEHAYGVAAQVSGTTDSSLSVTLAFFPGEKAENEKFSKVVKSRLPARYHQSYNVAETVGISGFSLAKITSSFMVASGDNSKTNLGLNLKFEAKGLKVLDYSRKQGRTWEFSDKAVELLQEYKAKFPELFQSIDQRKDDIVHSRDLFRTGNPDLKVKEVKSWLASKGVRDFEPVSLNTDQLKRETVKEIEALADTFNATRSTDSIKKAIVNKIPRQAVLKPSHAIYRLQNQTFALGDRVAMVQDSGTVPLCAKGVVVGVNTASIDVVWDVAFISGTTLNDRCSEYRGSTMTFNSCLNLTNQQYAIGTSPRAQSSSQQPQPQQQQQQQQSGQYTHHNTNGNFNGPSNRGRGRGGQATSSHFRPAIMANPNRGPPRGIPPPPPAAIAATNGAPTYNAKLKQTEAPPVPVVSHVESLLGTLSLQNQPNAASTSQSPRQHINQQSGPPTRGGGFSPRGRGTRGGNTPGFVPRGRGRGGFQPRGRGGGVNGVGIPAPNGAPAPSPAAA